MAQTSKVLENTPTKCIIDNKISSKSTEGVYDSVCVQLLGEVERVYKESGKITDEVLSALHSVFQAPLLPALDLVDSRAVTLVSSPSGRSVYQVIGSSGTPYTCFTTSNYCSCPAYRFSVIKKADHVMCKHLIAIKLSTAMNICKTSQVSDQELANIITQIE